MAGLKFGVVPLPEGLSLSHPTSFLATWFGMGLLRPAPGTMGALGALPFAWVFLSYGDWPYLLGITIAFTWLGVRVADDYSRAEGGEDPASVVIDEVVGVWIALLAAPLSWAGFLTAFLAFRFYDILKPWPVSWADKNLKGGLGIMLDDVFAGIYALIVVYLFAYYGVIT